MLVICAGMPKSGSAYFYNVINELISESGCGQDARQVKKQAKLGKLLRWRNNNLERLSTFSLLRLWLASIRHGTFAVKTHSGPTRASKYLNRMGLIRIVYSYRDPRDVVLSGLDHGRQIRAQGEDHTFASMVDLESALIQMRPWLTVWEQYSAMQDVFTVKYEEAVQSPEGAFGEIADFLGLEVQSQVKQDILWRYSRNNPSGIRDGMHFNKAYPFRYKSEMSQADLARCHTELGSFLQAMEYQHD